MEFYAKEEKDLERIAQEWTPFFKNHHVFAFKGEMGAGKTTFISYLAQAMNCEDEVRSPTYAYVNEYKSADFGRIYHFDFYRLEDENEAYDIGIEEYFYEDAILFLEWPEKIQNLLPDSCVWVTITKDENEGRMIEIRL